MTLDLFPSPADVRQLFLCRAGAVEAREVHPTLRPLIGVPAEDIAAWHERTRTDRRVSGTYYTPPALADALVDAALDTLGRKPERVLDPTCGAGSILAAVADRLEAHGAGGDDIVRALAGIDVDPMALAIAKWRLLERGGRVLDPPAEHDAQWLVADALAVDTCPAEPPDLVIGNPPFGNAIGRETRRSDPERADYAHRFPHAARGAYDRAGLFLERAIEWVRPGGCVALVLPRAMLAASYADALRQWIEREHRLDAIVATSAADHFDAADILVVGVVVRVAPQATQPSRTVRCIQLDGTTRARPLPPDAAWAALVSEHAHALDAIGDDWSRLDAIATLQAGASTGEAYDVKPHVTDTPPDDGWRLVTTGLIDPHVLLWGTRRCRYLGEDFETPWLPRHAVSPRRAALYDRPKILVAGLSKVLEAVVDADGSYAGAVATLALTVDGDRPEALAALCDWLDSDDARAQYAARFGAQELSGGSVQVTKRNLGALRVPPALAMVVAPQRC